MKVIIFDFDGTIADSFDTVLEISNRLAAEFGYPTTRLEEVDQLRNLSAREVLRRSQIPFFKLPFLLRRLRSELNQEISQLKLIPGMQEALVSLKQSGNQLGIVTSNSQENVTAFLEAQGLGNLFDFVGSGLTLFGKGGIIQRFLKQHSIEPALAIYVGDETRDIEAARKVGIKVIAVSWGFNSSQALDEYQPDYLVHQPAELIHVVGND